MSIKVETFASYGMHSLHAFSSLFSLVGYRQILHTELSCVKHGCVFPSFSSLEKLGQQRSFLSQNANKTAKSSFSFQVNIWKAYVLAEYK